MPKKLISLNCKYCKEQVKKRYNSKEPRAINGDLYGRSGGELYHFDCLKRATTIVREFKLKRAIVDNYLSNKPKIRAKANERYALKKLAEGIIVKPRRRTFS